MQYPFHNARLNEEITHAYHAVALDEARKDFPPCLWDESAAKPGQTVEQVWFAGAHSDVGGWYDERGLSDIALRWMLENAGNCGMRLKREVFANVKGDPLGKLHNSYTAFWRFRGKHKRQVPAQGKVHKSVQTRMEQAGYKPVMPLPGDAEFVE